MPETSYETLEVDLTDGILTVALHRPERMNAFNMTMADELVRVLPRQRRNEIAIDIQLNASKPRQVS